MTIEEDGAQLMPALLDEAALEALEGVLSAHMDGSPGRRLFGAPGLAAALHRTGPIGAVAAPRLGNGTRPVRAILLDKTAETNWSLAWHQDRVIAVERRVEVDGFGPWSRKHGALHVAPPFDILQRMLTLRLHLDDVDAENAPLLVSPGSHRLGRVAESDIPDAVRRCGTTGCVAARGDAWLYATPILHASERATKPSRRRVLQVDFAATDLPGGLCWLGV